MTPDIRIALDTARTQLLDLKHGYPERELVEPLQTTIDRIDRVFAEEDERDPIPGPIFGQEETP